METKTVVSIDGMTAILRGGVEIEAHPDVDGFSISHYPYVGERRSYIGVYTRPVVMTVETEVIA